MIFDSGIAYSRFRNFAPSLRPHNATHILNLEPLERTARVPIRVETPERDEHYGAIQCPPHAKSVEHGPSPDYGGVNE